VERVEDMDELTSSRIGVEPFNLPLNADITETLPALFEVDSYQGELTIGANPWHYITKKSATQLEVFTLKNIIFSLANKIKFHVSLLRTP
jgi:DDB1- and CUL4-associated factor 17